MAEFQKVVADAKRMCRFKGWDCEQCPVVGHCMVDCRDDECRADEYEDIVESWAAAHPAKTNRMVLEEMWPNINLDVFCPRHAGMQQDCYPNAICKNCRQKFLDAEYKAAMKGT